MRGSVPSRAGIAAGSGSLFPAMSRTAAGSKFPFLFLLYDHLANFCSAAVAPLEFCDEKLLSRFRVPERTRFREL